MTDDKLSRLLTKRAALDARIRREQGLGRKKLRQLDTRKKILVGAAALAEAERSPEYRAELLKLLARFLTRPDDRALFNLPIAENGAPASTAWPRGGELDRLDPAHQPGH